MTGASDKHVNADQCKIDHVLDKKVEGNIVFQNKHCVINEEALNSEVKQCTENVNVVSCAHKGVWSNSDNKSVKINDNKQVISDKQGGVQLKEQVISAGLVKSNTTDVAHKSDIVIINGDSDKSDIIISNDNSDNNSGKRIDNDHVSNKEHARLQNKNQTKSGGLVKSNTTNVQNGSSINNEIQQSVKSVLQADNDIMLLNKFLVKNAQCNKTGIKMLDSYHDVSFTQEDSQSSTQPLPAPPRVVMFSSTSSKGLINK